jgi:endonuclease III
MYAAHVLLIHHGRAICHAQNPKHDLCPLRDRCRAVTPKVR